MYDLITIGDCMIDAFHVLEDHEIDVICSLDTEECQLCMTYADKIPVKEIHKLVAGNAANNAVGSSRLGIRTAIYTVLGDDVAAEMIKQKLQEEGVALDYVLCQRGGESNYSTVLSYRGERTILVYHAKRHFRFPAMQSAKWVYYTSMTKEGHEAITPDLIRYQADHRSKLIYQPGTFQLRLGPAATSDLLKVTEVIIMNAQEAERYLERESKTPIKDLLTGLRTLGPEIAVITDGTKGSYAVSSEGIWFCGIRPEIPRKEATGAGDAYATGFAAALMHDKEISEAMRWATFNAEGVIQQIGPQAGLLNYEAMEHELAKNIHFQAQSLKETL